jgi:hypothetical protein
MSGSSLAPDFDDVMVEPIGHLEQSAPLKRKEKSSYYNHPKCSAFFQICQSCFWCASNLYESRVMEKCPSCKSSKISSFYPYHLMGFTISSKYLISTHRATNSRFK